MSEDELIYLKENLVMAELSKRKYDFIKTHKAYKNIGDFFKQKREYETAIYFYNKCYDIFSSENLGPGTGINKIKNSHSHNSDDENAEKFQDIQLETYLDLGLTYESLKEINNAIKFHEKYLELVTILSREQDIKFANRNLIRTFKLQSDQLVENGKYEEAINVLTKCISAGQSAHDLKGEAIAHKTLANILMKLEKFNKATVHFKKYLKICLEMDDKKGEGQGYLMLGRTYQKLGDNVLATKYFQSYMDIAETNGEINDESKAALALGDIYCDINNQSNKAIELYQKNFELSRKLNKKQEVNDARIKLGIAKSKQQIDQYIKVLTNGDQASLIQLLEWKNKRKPIHVIDDNIYDY